MLLGWTLSHSFPSPVPTVLLQTLLCYPVSPYCANPGFSPVVRPWRYLLHFPSRITSKYSLRFMLEPPHFVYSLFDVFRSVIRGITSASLSDAPRYSLTTACWYMCVSGKSLNALVARDKTRSSRSLAGIIELDLGRFWEFSKIKPFF